MHPRIRASWPVLFGRQSDATAHWQLNRFPHYDSLSGAQYRQNIKQTDQSIRERALNPFAVCWICKTQGKKCSTLR